MAGKIIRVKGVTFGKRQKHLKHMSNNSKIRLKPDPDNPVDPYAIKILADGWHIGFLPKKIARKVSETWDLYKYFVLLYRIIPGDDHPDHQRSWGVRIKLYRIRRK